MDETRSTQENQGEYRDKYQTTKFRFKDSSKRRANEGKVFKNYIADERQRSRRHRSSGKSKHKRLKERNFTHEKPFTENETVSEDSCLPNSTTEGFIDPEVAFRESLFDAMRDDEGAEFWEGVYGQPIHTYPNTKSGPDGKLERMTDDEYAAYVRTKMYEKTHQYLVEEKARRDNAKKQREKILEESAKQERESERFRRKLEKCMKMCREKALRKDYSEKWTNYLIKWDILEKDGPKEITLASIPWPVASGKRSDVNPDEIERFLTFAPSGGQLSETQLRDLLKVERVRWHPDKIQQRLGGQDVHQSILQASTSVFQVIDKLWSRMRDVNA